MIRASELDHKDHQRFIEIVDGLLTPESLLSQESFDEPAIITQQFINFNLLLTQRNAIRDLKLMPLKEETLHASYNALSREMLFHRLTEKLKHESMIVALNEYPYQLPKDVLQCIMWIKEDATSRGKIVEFLAKMMKKYELDDVDLILFERSRVSKSKYVKRSFPFMRHIHVWSRKNSLLSDAFVIE